MPDGKLPERLPKGVEANHDALPGLVNRREFERRLRRAMQRSPPPAREEAALLYMDLDPFKIVNDTCGHPAGLKAIGVDFVRA